MFLEKLFQNAQDFSEDLEEARLWRDPEQNTLLASYTKAKDPKLVLELLEAIRARNFEIRKEITLVPVGRAA